MTADRKRLFCFDGTNLTRGVWEADPAARREEDEEARRLVETLSRLCEEAGERLEIELFFDGPSRGWRWNAANLRVRASHEEPADRLILDRVRARTFAGGGVTVVTADGELGRQAEQEGARWLKASPGGGFDGVVRSIAARFLK